MKYVPAKMKTKKKQKLYTIHDHMPILKVELNFEK